MMKVKIIFIVSQLAGVAFISFLLLVVAFQSNAEPELYAVPRTHNIDNKCIEADLEGLLQNHTGSFNMKRYRGQLAAMINEANKNRKRGAFLQIGAEVGVFKGQLSSIMLQSVPSITKYYLVDSWKHLDGWNMPFNDNTDETFQGIFQEAMAKTRDHPLHGHKVEVLREVSDIARNLIPAGSLDFVYIDGDHTAKGVILDLLIWLPKVRCGGLVLGDDYTDNMDYWGLGIGKYDPIFVKSPVDAFAKGLGVQVYDLGAGNWAFVKPHQSYQL